MVSMYCANYRINVFQKKLKVLFDKNEHELTGELWCQIVSTKPPSPSSTHQQQNEFSDEDKQEQPASPQLNEFVLSTVKKFIQQNSAKIGKIVDMNVQLCMTMPRMKIDMCSKCSIHGKYSFLTSNSICFTHVCKYLEMILKDSLKVSHACNETLQVRKFNIIKIIIIII